MIGIERAKEIGEYVNKYGFEPAKDMFKIGDETLLRYLRVYRKCMSDVPKEPHEVKTVQDALLFGNVDAFPNMKIQSVKVNTWGNEANPNKQVTVKMLPSTDISTDAILEDFKKEIENYVPVKYPTVERTKTTENNNLLLIALPDIHHALLTHEEETGENYDIKISRERVIGAVKYLLDAGTVHHIDKIILSMNGDIMNSDGISGTTTGGTPQSEDTRWYKSFTTCWKLIRDITEMCREKADVEVVINQGNHDKQVSYFLGETLSAWFRDDRHVTVDNAPKHYKYKKFGKTMIGLSHGDGAKSPNLPLLMATDQPMMWAETSHRYFLIGHYHASSSKGFQMESENPGCVVTVCPALSSASDWTAKMGFRSIPEAQAYIYNDIRGRIATYHYRVV